MLGGGADAATLCFQDSSIGTQFTRAAASLVPYSRQFCAEDWTPTACVGPGKVSIYIYVYIYVYMCIYIFIFIYIYVCVNVYICIYIYIYMCVNIDR